jgi:hypothetical protein
MTEHETTAITKQDVEKVVSVISINDAEKILGIKNEPPYDIKKLLHEYHIGFEVLMENREFKKLRPLTDAKNIILRHLIENQVEENGRFDMEGVIPFEDACTSCHGTGELYKFFRRVVTLDCKFCEGEGEVTLECRACGGSGRYIREYGDLKIDVACKKCDKDPETGDPLGVVTYKCRRCRGKGTFRKTVIDSKIKSTTHCKVCKGRGFIVPDDRFPPRRGQTIQIANPVIKESDLESIGSVIKESKPEAAEISIEEDNLESLESAIKDSPASE